MVKTRIFPGLDSLVDLADVGVDIRPTLLRVLTDLFVQQPTHSGDEERQYCELAQRLIAAVDLPTRVAVAAKLGAYPGAPAEILDRLRRDAVEVREVLLASAPERRHAASVLAAGQGRAIDPAAAETAELSALFAAAPAEERRLILLNIDAPAPQPRDDLFAAPSAIAALETLALQRRSEEFVKGLGRLLAVSDEHARWIVQDQGGEPVVVAAKALGMPSEVLQRVLLFLNPAIGHSVRRVYDLVRLHEDATVEAAHALVSIWQTAHPRVKRPLNTGPTPRHAGSEYVRPAAARPAERRQDSSPTSLRDRWQKR